MKLSKVTQGSAAIFKEQFDVVIAASGYEVRAPFLAQRLGRNVAGTRLVFGFPDRKNTIRRANDRDFAKLGYHPIEAPGNSADLLKHCIKDTLSQIDRSSVNLLIDYSCMTKTWYAGILRTLATGDFKQDKIRVAFSYSCSRFSMPSAPTPNRYMEPVPGYFHLDLPDKKSALVLGLGYEAERAAGLVEYVEPAETYAFYTDPAIDHLFPDTVKKNNSELLKRLGPDRIFTYSMTDIATPSTLLSSLCFGLAKSHRIILAPLGPKPFALLCFLLALRNPRFDVWRVSSGEGGGTPERPPADQTIIADVLFQKEQMLSI
jgi:hypothetical protein